VAALAELTRKLRIDPEASACIVDDTPDLPLMSAVGSRPRCGRASAGQIGRALDQQGPGGAGAVRELCDAILRARARGGYAEWPSGYSPCSRSSRWDQHLDPEFAESHTGAERPGVALPGTISRTPF